MINITTMELKVDRVDEGSAFFIWTETMDNEVIGVHKWIPLLFAWHELTFFGSALEPTERAEKEGVLLSAWTALDFFARTPHSSLTDIRRSEEIVRYEQMAKSLFTAIAEGDFIPNYAAWQTDGFGWKASDDPIANEWLSFALTDLFARHDELEAAWSHLREQYPLITSAGNAHLSFGENRWLERIGWKKDKTPFTVGLRLSEPAEDEEDDDWKLDIMLRGKDTPDKLHIWKHDNVEALPAHWRESLLRLTEEADYWFTVASWLRPEEADENKLIRQTLSEAEAWLFLTDTSLQLAETGTEVLLPAWWKELQVNDPKLKMQVKSSVGRSANTFVGLNQLLSFDWKVATGDLELSESEFQDLVAENRRLVRIQGKWVKLDPAFVKQMQALMQRVNESGLSFSDVLAKEMLPDEPEFRDSIAGDDPLSQVSVELNRHLMLMIEQLRQVKEVPELPIPDGFVGELRPYQKKGMEWLVFLHRYGLGALLADDMGLGKTIQTIAYFLAINEEEKKQQPMLIVCPTSVLGNWEKEFQRFAPNLNVVLHYGTNRASADGFAEAIHEAKAHIVITSYNLAHLDEETLTSVTWRAVCLDEAQNIKNVYTKQARAVKRLQAEHKIALTGTPIENRLTELWSIFDFLNPGYFGSLNRFRERYVHPIERDNDKQKITDVQQLIRPFFMRRSKRDPDIELNLPDKLEQKEYTPLTAEQASLYEQIIDDTFSEIEARSGIERRGLILAMLTKLKQICNHPALFLKEERTEGLLERSHKTEKLVELVRAIREQNESCLIFTQYVGMGKMLATLLEETFHEKVAFLHGGVRKTARDNMIDRFQNGESAIFVLSLKAGGTGLNLTAANHVIHYDRWWNPAVENQATDRAHRIGQNRFVHVHKLITTGTLEEKIDEMLERKQSLSDEIIQSENWITELPTTELRDLFMLRHE